MTVKSEPLRYAFDAPLRSPARAKIAAASIGFPMRCHSVGSGTPGQMHAVIRVYDDAGNVIATHEHAGDVKEL
jgi:hypothetical protein